VTVVEQVYDDARTVTLALTAGPEEHFQAPRPGRLTSSACAVGAEFVSGGSAVGIDGVPLLNLATAVPLWRDLALGDVGPDVAALGAELVRLGRLAEPVPEQVDAALLAAFAAAATDVGIGAGALTRGAVSVGLVGWLPAPTAVAAECLTAVGDQVVAGGALASFVRTVLAARIAAPPADLVPGDRLLAVDSASLPVGGDGRLTDPETLASLLVLPSIEAALQPGGSGAVPAKLALAEPVSTGVVPAAAIVVQGDGGACLLAADGPVAATVVGSQLGQVFVLFQDDRPDRVESQPPRSLTCPR
jgi:hypothetical protein